MRAFLYILFSLCSLSVLAQDREVVVSYTTTSLPELYNKAELTIAVKKGAEYHTYNGKYKLSSSIGKVQGRTLYFDRAEVHARKGQWPIEITFPDKSTSKATLELPTLDSIRFNLYTDSIKPVLNYYLNVEGVFSSGKIYPLDTSFITISCDKSHMNGMEWVIPKKIDFEKVTFTVISKYDPTLFKKVTLYIRKYWEDDTLEKY